MPGIGLKTGAKLLEEFGTLENLLASVDKVSAAKRKENLRDFAETARRAGTLIALRTDLPLLLDWDALKLTAPDREALRKLCIECGFHRFLAELGPDESKPKAVWTADYQVVDTPRSCVLSLMNWNGSPGFASTPRRPPSIRCANLVGLAFSWEEGKAFYLPVRERSNDALLKRLKRTPVSDVCISVITKSQTPVRGRGVSSTLAGRGGP